VYGKITGTGFWGGTFHNPYMVHYVGLSQDSEDFCESPFVEPLRLASVVAASSNMAVAIELYPSRLPGSWSWMTQGNPRVKWMCLLSNGIDFYRDAQSGEPMWFNCAVEWVDKIPAEGELR
jgi:hypothetical protein